MEMAVAGEARGDGFLKAIRDVVTTRIVGTLEDPDSARPEADYSGMCVLMAR